ncbi:MAG: endonuclease I family protein [Chitinophagales bacterium]
MTVKTLLLFAAFFLYNCDNLQTQPNASFKTKNGEKFHEGIFPHEKGTKLLQKLQKKYKPNQVLGYGAARDVLYKETADYHEFRLTCVYTGYSIWLDPRQDPSTNAYEQGMNCEHSWPQSMGAKGQAKSDMHHLFPTREGVNAARSNHPFGEVPDHETDRWYLSDVIQDEIPTKNIDGYSELDSDSGHFEPREDMKGNIARAMFYFYTMYNNQSGVNTSFFEGQKNTLRQWHIADPVDDFEAHRNHFIAKHQDGKVNPFIEDRSLVERAFFEN